ncbi:hypothetical protein SAMN04488005_1467 [Yoonia tamlensis]|uniref:Uncharacterized protein n=1 Tax=Yoonia tamlensis TaxID=390270 RepID=A0A1I6GDM8_9RHOB|nr:hypothetical protein [Yoonia tamlensis]SFR40230.1 hypothetical protein SAMN04488005_1467 [Yoonia tamlensis]
MAFTPETQILALNLVILGVAYLGIYPSLQNKTMDRIMQIDLVLTALALIVSGALFWGTGVRFNLFFFQSNWAVFALVTSALIEVPLFAFFVKRHNIKICGD